MDVFVRHRHPRRVAEAIEAATRRNWTRDILVPEIHRTGSLPRLQSSFHHDVLIARSTSKGQPLSLNRSEAAG